MHVDVDEDSEQARKDLLAGLLERFWEVPVLAPGEDRLVAEVRVNPVEQLVDVIRCGEGGRFLS
jgi:hypothetical protein